MPCFTVSFQFDNFYASFLGKIKNEMIEKYMRRIYGYF